jgi:hypothetical protein
MPRGAGIQLRWIGSGNAYIALSGGNPPKSGNFMTINSGTFPLSGGAASGMLDGMVMLTGDAYFIPQIVLGSKGGATSGSFNIYGLQDAAASGGRMYFEVL